MKVSRSPENPLIRPQDIKPSNENFEVIGVFNPAVNRFKDEIVLLIRVAERPINNNPDVVLCPVYDPKEEKTITKEFDRNNPDIDFSDPRLIITPAGTYLTSISHLRLASSKDGAKFDIEDTPTLSPESNYETFGIEDARISLIDETYYITYVGVSSLGVTTNLASTQDFRSFQRHGVIFCPDNKDVAILPERIGEKYYALHRPTSPLFGKQQIWLAESPDLICWGNHRCIMKTRTNSWDDIKIGAGAVPFKTERGWIHIYHGADRRNRYCLGAVLLDIEKPWLVLTRTEQPIFEPQASYECNGFFANVVFTGGLLFEENTLKIFYGAADTTVCCVQIPLDDVFQLLNSSI